MRVKAKKNTATPVKERKWRFADISTMAGVKTESAKIYRQFMLGKLDGDTAGKARWLLQQHLAVQEAMQMIELQRAIDEMERRLAELNARPVGPAINGNTMQDQARLLLASPGPEIRN